jgi:hypothetical protein
VIDALTDGRAVCVHDAVAPARGVRLVAARDAKGLDLHVESPDLTAARFTLLRDGAPIAQRAAPAPGGAVVVSFECGAPRCAPGDYRVEGTIGGRAWIFTNPVGIE